MINKILIFLGHKWLIISDNFDKLKNNLVYAESAKVGTRVLSRESVS